MRHATTTARSEFQAAVAAVPLARHAETLIQGSATSHINCNLVKLAERKLRAAINAAEACYMDYAINDNGTKSASLAVNCDMTTLTEKLTQRIQRIQGLEPEEPLSAAIKPAYPTIKATPPPLPTKPEEPLPAGIKPAHPTITARYMRGTYLRQLLGITEVARLPFELKEPQYDCSNLQALSRELSITCTLIAMLYEKVGTLKPEASEITRQAEWNLCHECIKAEQEIRDRLLSLEARLKYEPRNAA